MFIGATHKLKPAVQPTNTLFLNGALFQEPLQQIIKHKLLYFLLN